MGSRSMRFPKCRWLHRDLIVVGDPLIHRADLQKNDRSGRSVNPSGRPPKKNDRSWRSINPSGRPPKKTIVVGDPLIHRADIDSGLDPMGQGLTRIDGSMTPLPLGYDPMWIRCGQDRPRPTVGVLRLPRPQDLGRDGDRRTAFELHRAGGAPDRSTDSQRVEHDCQRHKCFDDAAFDSKQRNGKKN